MTNQTIPPATDADRAIDIAAWYPHWSGIVEGIIRRCHAAEQERDELRLMKIAYETTPKQWSTARAPTLESVVGMIHGIKAEKDRDALRALLAEAVWVMEPLARERFIPSREYSADCHRAAALLAKLKEVKT